MDGASDSDPTVRAERLRAPREPDYRAGRPPVPSAPVLIRKGPPGQPPLHDLWVIVDGRRLANPASLTVDSGGTLDVDVEVRIGSAGGRLVLSLNDRTRAYGVATYVLSERLGPGAQRFTVRWPLNGHDGRPLPPGRLHLRATLEEARSAAQFELGHIDIVSKSHK